MDREHDRYKELINTTTLENEVKETEGNEVQPPKDVGTNDDQAAGTGISTLQESPASPSSTVSSLSPPPASNILYEVVASLNMDQFEGLSVNQPMNDADLDTLFNEEGGLQPMEPTCHKSQVTAVQETSNNNMNVEITDSAGNIYLTTDKIDEFNIDQKSDMKEYRETDKDTIYIDLRSPVEAKVSTVEKDITTGVPEHNDSTVTDDMSHRNNKRKSRDFEVDSKSSVDVRNLVEDDVDSTIATEPPAKKCEQEPDVLEEYEEHVLYSKPKGEKNNPNYLHNRFEPIFLQEVVTVEANSSGKYSIINMKCSSDCEELMNFTDIRPILSRYIKKKPRAIDGFEPTGCSLEIGDEEWLTLISGRDQVVNGIQRLETVYTKKSKLTGLPEDSIYFTSIQKASQPHMCLYNSEMERERQLFVQRAHEGTNGYTDYHLSSSMIGEIEFRSIGFCRNLTDEKEIKHLTPQFLTGVQSCMFIHNQILQPSCAVLPSNLHTLISKFPEPVYIFNPSHFLFLRGTISHLDDQTALRVYSGVEAAQIISNHSDLSVGEGLEMVKRICLPVCSLYSGTNVFHTIVFTNNGHTFLIKPATMMKLLMLYGIRNRLIRIVN